MLYVSVSYAYSPDFNTPESWFKRTVGYSGLFECLSKNNEVISIKQINYEGEALHNGVQYRFVNLNRKKTHFPFKLNRFIKSLNPDIVIIQGLHNPVQVILLHFILSSKTKIIAHHHAEKPLKGFKKYIQLIADKYIDAYLFASHDMGFEWVKNGNMKSVNKLHEVMEVSSKFYPVDKQQARLKTGVKGEQVFLWVGRLNDNKDPLNVVRAFLRYSQSNPGAHLYMIYHIDELLNDIKALLKSDSAKDAIVFIGKVDHSELLYWFNSADFIISGSHYEAAGTAICEAMSCGCVPIITDIFSFRMMTDKGKCGMLYEVGNEDALLAALEQTNKIDITEKRNLSLEYFQKKLSFDAIAEDIEDIVADL